MRSPGNDDISTVCASWLLQVGHCQVALSMGAELLQTPDAQLPLPVRRDVLLSMALANCGMASEVLEGGNVQVRSR